MKRERERERGLPLNAADEWLGIGRPLCMWLNPPLTGGNLFFLSMIPGNRKLFRLSLLLNRNICAYFFILLVKKCNL